MYIDPLWVSSHDNSLNHYQRVYDERLTKTIRLKYGLAKGEFDAVSLGSSRGTYLPVENFDHYRVFNYAVSALYPGEYIKMLELFAEEQGEPSAIVIGADFYATRNDWEDRIGPYIDDVSDPRFVLKRIISIDTFNLARRIARDNINSNILASGMELYNRKMRKELFRHDNWDPFYEPMLSKYCRIVYGRSYTWNKKLPEIFLALKKRFPNTRFIVYTSPTMGTFYDAMIFRERFDDYARWVELLVGIFGEVYDLLGHNNFTDNPDNYYDYHHFSAQAGAWLIDHVLERQHPEVGVLVTKSNLKFHLKEKADEAREILNNNQNPCLLWPPHA